MLLAAFVVEIGLITYRGFRCAGAHLPPPADYTGAVLIYGGLGLAAKTQAAHVAGLIGWGFVVATALNLWTPQHPTKVGSHSAPPAQKVHAS
ncbi:MAG: hypothetical protein M0Z46_19920 [Actinomycetota bacterium]|nr:hypothetical protein [Actinomycetota bacterium]